MKISREDLEITYSEKSDEELEWIYNSASLTKLARGVLEEELHRRGCEFKKRTRAPRVVQSKSNMNLNDKIYGSLLIGACVVLVLGPLFSRGVNVFHYHPTPIYGDFILVFTVVLGGYFILTDFCNFKAKRTLIQNPLIYQDKVGSSKGSRYYRPSLLRLVSSPIGTVIIHVFNVIIKLFLVFSLAYSGIAGILVGLGFRAFVL